MIYLIIIAFDGVFDNHNFLWDIYVLNTEPFLRDFTGMRYLQKTAELLDNSKSSMDFRVFKPIRSFRNTQNKRGKYSIMKYSNNIFHTYRGNLNQILAYRLLNSKEKKN